MGRPGGPADTKPIDLTNICQNHATERVRMRISYTAPLPSPSPGAPHRKYLCNVNA